MGTALTRRGLLRSIHMEQMNQVIQDALGKLDDNAARMIYLHYFEYKTFQEISDEMDVPLGTVCTKISRSLKAMHKLIKREGYHTRDVIWTRLGIDED